MQVFPDSDEFYAAARKTEAMRAAGAGEVSLARYGSVLWWVVITSVIVGSWLFTRTAPAVDDLVLLLMGCGAYVAACTAMCREITVETFPTRLGPSPAYGEAVWDRLEAVDRTGLVLASLGLMSPGCRLVPFGLWLIAWSAVMRHNLKKAAR